ncbi:hypothetical protein LZ31DRAFT_560193 [Colletotrichum somersetense]|nr:hypothetical protein LZ31DRAFT_560193 [Colletotrichum somersetense]
MSQRMPPQCLGQEQPYNDSPLRTAIDLAFDHTACSRNTETCGIRLLIPTQNKKKTSLIKGIVARHLAEHAPNLPLECEQVSAESGGGEQPFEEEGPEGLKGRARNALNLARPSEKTTIIGAVENFIERPLAGQEADGAHDYGIIGFYNVSKKDWTWEVTLGVKVDQRYLEEAMSKGFDDEAKKKGKVTYGKVLANYFDVDHADWHPHVCGSSRYELLENAAKRLDMSRILDL